MMERRTFSGQVALETRSDGQQFFVGYAAVFYRPGQSGTEFNAGPFVERIAPAAFNEQLRARADVRGLYNHDSNFVLGRTAADTMRLTVDTLGLRYEIKHNAMDPQHISVAEKIRRRDVTGSSFAFSVAPAGQVWSTEAGKEIRTIVNVSGLFDVGPVTYPAYSGTTTTISG